MKYVSPHLRLHKSSHQDTGGHSGPGQMRKAADGKGGPEHPVGGEDAPEHVMHTHPGETEAHPHTGVHAVHVHHVGGGKYMTHTHHKDGSVDTEHHQDIHSVHDHMHEMFPTAEGDDQQHDQNADNDTYAGGGSAANMMSSLGGE